MRIEKNKMKQERKEENWEEKKCKKNYQIFFTEYSWEHS